MDGKKRFICNSTPVILAVTSLICLVLVAIGGPNAVSRNQGLFSVNVSNITSHNALDLLPDSAFTTSFILGGTFQNFQSSVIQQDVYAVYLWNYCTTSTKGSSPSNCTSPSVSFWYDPDAVWGFNVTALGDDTSALSTALNTYKDTSKWMSAVYILALAAISAEILSGIATVFGALGRFTSMMISIVSSLLVLAAAITSTDLFFTVTKAINLNFRSNGIVSSVTANMLAVTWLAVLFSWAASLFGLIDACYFSTSRRDRLGAKRRKGANVGYKPINDPSAGEQEATPMEDLPMQQHPTDDANVSPYEPYRGQGN